MKQSLSWRQQRQIMLLEGIFVNCLEKFCLKWGVEYFRLFRDSCKKFSVEQTNPLGRQALF